MPNVAVYNIAGEKTGDMELNEEFFGVEMNAGLLHQAVVLQQASMRLGTHSTKTRGMVRGGGRKPWKQKGTGRARSGSTRSPIWVGGGTVFGPQPRKYGFKMPKKQRRLALKCALSDKVKNGDFLVLETLDFDAPKTKQVVKMLGDFKVDKKALFITGKYLKDENDKEIFQGYAENVDLSSRNIQGVKTITAEGINVLDILGHGKLFVTKDAIRRIEEVFA